MQLPPIIGFKVGTDLGVDGTEAILLKCYFVKNTI